MVYQIVGMKNKIGCIAVCFLLLGIEVKAQVGEFNKSVNRIAIQIQNETVKEKLVLKNKVDSLYVLVDNQKLSEEEGQDLKTKLAEESTLRLERKINQLNDSLSSLVQNNVEHAVKKGVLIEELDTVSTDSYNTIFGKDAFYNQNKDGKRILGERRTTFRLHFIYGMSNLVTNGSVANSDIRYIPSNFIQAGYNLKTRVLKNNNLLYLRYGFNIEFNSLKPTEHRYFKVENGQAIISKHEKDLTKSRLNLQSFQIPLYLEFDFTPKLIDEKTGRTFFRSEESWRLGVGGYVNFSWTQRDGQQIYHYSEDQVRYRIEKTEDLGLNKTRYGLGAYVGYGMFSLFAQYELTPLFKNNTVKQNMASFGVRMDF